MKRIFGAALLALPALLAGGSDASAQCSSCGPGGGPAISRLTAAGGCGYLGCGGFCMRSFTHIHQHGPLYNYGPYYGYYPFAPYGPWDANLNYTGPTPGPVGCGWIGHGGLWGHGGCASCGGGWGGWGGWGHARGCSSCGGGWGHYSWLTFHNVFQRTHPLWNRATYSTGCSACSR